MTTTDPAPSLAELRSSLAAALAAHPDLRRGLQAAIVGIDRRLVRAPAAEVRDPISLPDLPASPFDRPLAELLHP